MRIEQDVKLDFSDVLLKPKRSTIESRKEIDLTRTFTFKNSRNVWTGVPIISSNMTSVTTKEAALVVMNHGMLACLPKNWNRKYFDSTGTGNFISSYGLEFTEPLFDKNQFICIDVPNGYIEQVVQLTKKIRIAYPDYTLIVGNVVTAEMTEALILAGADVVKVGIGGGSACSTRIKTGVGVPQLSAVMECADAAHGLGGHVISDGGCATPGDIVKAFAAGADFVMLGGMLAGHDENGTYGMSSERGNNELGTCNKCGSRYTGRPEAAICAHEWSGLKNYRAAEGWEVKLPARGPIENTLQDIEGGLRSACSYVGAKNIKALPKCATFVQVNRQANTSLWEHRI